jgi:hypothetical protein
MSLQVDRNNALRAYLRNKVSQALLAQLLEAATEREAAEGVGSGGGEREGEEVEETKGSPQPGGKMVLHALDNSAFLSEPYQPQPNTNSASSPTSSPSGTTPTLQQMSMLDVSQGDTMGMDVDNKGMASKSTTSGSSQAMSEIDIEIQLTLLAKNTNFQVGSQV